MKLSEAEDAERKDFEAHFQKEKELYNALIVRENSFQTQLKKEAAQIDAQLLLFEKYFGISLDIDPLTSEKTFTFTHLIPDKDYTCRFCIHIPEGSDMLMISKCVPELKKDRFEECKKECEGKPIVEILYTVRNTFIAHFREAEEEEEMEGKE
ncbi:hypothetical protein ADUPG1_009324 [Aduncisulcus paluster]|uniref:Kinetochore protein SPC25 n=1 Tax=Aduncisulcus paluster TaxID=2918883 RepID=A0ABQ5KV73_9EUKA|nr:hypothetical protein ADUPG1_009324 [Aduncisulcus paluster]